MNEFVPDGTRRIALGLALATAGGVGVLKGANDFLAGQAKVARKVIPKPDGRPFDGDGVYRPGRLSPERWRVGVDYDFHMMVFGDSLAAGLGAGSPHELPGVLLARGLAEESGRSVRLSIKAIVGATSKGLEGQVEAMEITGGRPDISVILIGGNDVTARNGITPSARRLGRAVARLVDSGSHVVVGTCPDLGTIRPVPQPLRSVMQALSLRLSAAQKHHVLRAGGVPVSIAQTLAPEFRNNPDGLFSDDRFHPNSAGYELAAGLLLPAVFETMGIWDAGEIAAPADEEVPAPPTPAEVEETAPVGDEVPVCAPAPAEAAEAAETTADEAVPADDAPAPAPRDSVIRRLTSRLTTFVRDHDSDESPIPEATGANVEVNSEADDPEQVRRAEENLRRRSRILTGDGDDGSQPD